MTVKAPQAIIDQAQEIIGNLPRKDWPEDESYDLGDGWDLYVYRDEKDRNSRCAKVIDRDNEPAKIWNNIQ